MKTRRALPPADQRQVIEQLTSTIRGSVRGATDAAVKARAVVDPSMLRGALLQQMKGGV